MKRKVNKTDAMLFLKNKGIDESLNNIRTLKHTALLMEEYAIFKLKEEARWLFIEQAKMEATIINFTKELPKYLNSGHSVESALKLYLNDNII